MRFRLHRGTVSALAMTARLAHPGHNLRSATQNARSMSSSGGRVLMRDNQRSSVVNCYNFLDPASPFGGYKQSGWGREKGRYGVEQYTEVKSVWVNLG